MSDLNRVKLLIAESALDYTTSLEKANRKYLSGVVRLEIERRLRAEARTIGVVVYMVAGISLTFVALTIERASVTYALMAVFGFSAAAVGQRLIARRVSRQLDQDVLERVGHADLAASEAYANMQLRRTQLLAPFGPSAHAKDPLNQENCS